MNQNLSMETTVFEAGMFGPTQIVLIVVAVILLFGAKKIPELMRGLGKGVKEFKDASKGEVEETSSSTEIKADDK